MHFHATAAAVSARPNCISTLRNRLLCGVCTAMLLAGSGEMALAHPSAEPSATAQPVTGTAAPIEKVSDPKPVGSRPKIDDLAVKQGDDRYFVEDEIGTATVAGRLTVSGESTVGAVTVNTGGKLYVSGHSAAGTVTVNEGGFAEAGNKVDTVTVTGKDSRLNVQAGTVGTVTVSKGGDVWVLGGKVETLKLNEGGLATLWSKIGTVSVVGKDSTLEVWKGALVGALEPIRPSTLETLSVSDGGYVKNEGKITKATVGNGGNLDVIKGGIAEDVTLQGEKVEVDKDGKEIHTVASAAVFDKNSLITKATVNVDGVLTVTSEGTADAVTVNKGGKLDVKTVLIFHGVPVTGTVNTVTVNEGGYAKTTGKIGVATVNNGGKLDVESGGTTDDVTVNGEKAWAAQQTGNGGIATVTGEKSKISKGTVNQGGLLSVINKATVDAVTVNNGGKLDVNTKGTADDVTVIGGYASTAGRINKAIVSKDGDTVGVLDVLDKGTVGAVTINAGAALGVETGGVAEDVTLAGGNAVTTGKIVKAMVNGGGKLDVNAGGKAEDVTVHGEKVEVDKDGKEIHTVASAVVSGKESLITKATVNVDGVLTVADEGTVGAVTVNKDGRLDVKVGGVADNVSVIDGVARTDGRINKATARDGMLLVDDKGTIGAVTLDAGGALAVFAGGTADTVTVNEGGNAVTTGKIVKAMVNGGGKLDVNAGGKAEDVTVHGEKVEVDKDGNEIHVVASAVVSGKESLITKATVNVDGVLTVADEGTVGAVTVNKDGRLDVWGGGRVEDVTVNGVTSSPNRGFGGLTNDDLGIVGGFASISGEGSRLESGTVNQGGLMEVSEKATVGTVTVNNGGKLDVDTGGKVDDVTVNGEKAGGDLGLGAIGGYAKVYGEGSRIEKGTVNLGGTLEVSNKATADAVTVNTGGALDIYGATVDDVTLNGGSALTGKGSRIRKATVEKDGLLEVAYQATAGTVIVNAGGKGTVESGGTADTVNVNDDGYAWTKGKIVTATIAGTGSRLDVLAGGTADTVNVNDGGNAKTAGRIGTATIAGTDSRLDVLAGGTAGTVNVNDGGNAKTAGRIGTATIAGTGSQLDVRAGGTAGTVNVNDDGYASTAGQIGTATIAGKGSQLDVLAGGTADTVNVNDSGYAWTSGQIGTATIAGKGSRLDVLAGGTADTVNMNDGGYARLLARSSRPPLPARVASWMFWLAVRPTPSM